MSDGPMPINKGPVLCKVTWKCDDDTISALHQLLKAAYAGELIGLAYTGLYRGSRFDCDVAGELRAQPVRGLGAAVLLQDQMLRLARGEED